MTQRRISFHIGHPKCASTTLQAALLANVDALRARGALVSDSRLRFPTEGPIDGPPTFHVDELLGRGEAGLHEVVRSLHQQSAALPARFDQLIVSAESLANPQAEFLAKALAPGYRVEVIYYVRRPQDFLVSAWAQWGCLVGRPLRAFVEREFELGRPAYWRIASRWHAFAAACHVRPLHASALRDGDVVRDLFAALGHGDLEIAAPTSRNPMLDHGVLEVFADSPFLFEDMHDTGLGDWLKQHGATGGDRPKLPRDLLEQVRARYDDDNRQLHQRYFPDVDFEQVLATDVDDAAPERSAEDELAAQLVRLRRVVGMQFAMMRRLGTR
ncbi:MAG: hypothetical protein KAI24_19545 [Planctomycetes bacterium]|nr:hypothetical protein [Planctomycetota bacterium]